MPNLLLGGEFTMAMNLCWLEPFCFQQREHATKLIRKVEAQRRWQLNRIVGLRWDGQSQVLQMAAKYVGYSCPEWVACPVDTRQLTAFLEFQERYQSEIDAVLSGDIEAFLIWPGEVLENGNLTPELARKKARFETWVAY